MDRKKYCYDYPRMALTTDCVILTYFDKNIRILLIQRGDPPFKGMWALPGGFVNMDETTEEGVKREVLEETGIILNTVEQIHTFSALNRDPRHRTVSVVYLAMVKFSDNKPRAGDDAANVKWFPLHELPELAFDHRDVIKKANARLALLIKTKPIGMDLLEESFSPDDLIRIYEIFSGNSINKKKLIQFLNTRKIIYEPDKESFQFNKENYSRFREKGYLDPWG